MVEQDIAEELGLDFRIIHDVRRRGFQVRATVPMECCNRKDLSSFLRPN